MKNFLCLLLMAFVMACQSLPTIHPSGSGEIHFDCADPFTKHPYRFVHAIEARMPGDVRSSVIGITLVEPAGRFISCAIITAEGMTLWEAESSASGTIIHRALPPFDSARVSQNMLEDIKLVFLPPQGQLYQKGYLSDESKVCRYQEENGDWVDVKENKSGNVEIGLYSSSGALKRQILFKKIAKDIYQSIELQADAIFDYLLLMTLIDAQPIEQESKVNANID
ncbi:MAG: hypothetical protein QMD11_01165 [Smithella sp.]|nr:hypothetical protein [Smithella sp.]